MLRSSQAQVSKQIISYCTSSQCHFVIEHLRLGTGAGRPNTKLHLSGVICNILSPQMSRQHLQMQYGKLIEVLIVLHQVCSFLPSDWLLYLFMHSIQPIVIVTVASGLAARQYRKLHYDQFCPIRHPAPSIRYYSRSLAERRATCNKASIVSC